MLIDQLSYLNNFTSGGDHKPGQDAYDRLAELQSQLSTIESQLEQLEQQSAASTTE